MIHLVKRALWTAANAALEPTEDLRGIKTVRRSDWNEEPIRSLPSLSFEWGGGLTFTSFTNPLDIQFDISAILKTAFVKNPDDGQEAIEKLLWDMNDSSEWGLIPFLMSVRAIDLPPSPYRVLLTPKVGEPIVEKYETDSYTFSLITLIQCQIQRAPISRS